MISSSYTITGGPGTIITIGSDRIVAVDDIESQVTYEWEITENGRKYQERIDMPMEFTHQGPFGEGKI